MSVTAVRCQNRPGLRRGAAHLVRGLQFEFLKDLLRLRFGGGHCAGKRSKQNEKYKKRVVVEPVRSQSGERKGRTWSESIAPGGPDWEFVIHITTCYACLFLPFIADHDSLFISLLVVFAVYYTCYFHDSVVSVALLYSRITDGKRIANTQ